MSLQVFLILVVVVVSGNPGPRPEPHPRPWPHPAPEPHPRPWPHPAPEPHPRPVVPVLAAAVPVAVTAVETVLSSPTLQKGVKAAGSGVVKGVKAAGNGAYLLATKAAGGAKHLWSALSGYVKGAPAAVASSVAVLDPSLTLALAEAAVVGQVPTDGDSDVTNAEESPNLSDPSSSSSSPVATVTRKPITLSNLLKNLGRVSDSAVQLSSSAVQVAGSVQTGLLNHAQTNAALAAAAAEAAAVEAAAAAAAAAAATTTLPPQTDVSIPRRFIRQSPPAQCPAVSQNRKEDGFTLGRKLKLVWFDDETNPTQVCRYDTKNVADTRQAYLQEYRPPTARQTIDPVLNHHRLRVLETIDNNRASIPNLALSPRVKRLTRPAGIRPFPEIRSGTKTILSWKGISWHTSLVTNACHLSHFLTYLILAGKQDTTYAQRNFLIPGSPGEGLLAQMISDYKQMPVKSPEAFLVQMHDNWKMVWVKAFYPEFKRQLANRQQINLIGSEYRSVVENLEPSSKMFLASICTCVRDNLPGIKVSALSSKVVDVIELRRLSRIEPIRRKANHRPDYDYPLSEPLRMSLLETSLKTCPMCKSDLLVDYIFVPGSTFFLYFEFRELDSRPVVDISQIPKKFLAHELFAHNEMAEFNLGYIVFRATTPGQSCTHAVSFQYLNGKFFYYDDVKGGELIYAPDPNLTIRIKSLSMLSVVYFRP